LLARSILQRLDGEQQYTLTDSAISVLQQHEYKGNVRELRNILMRALVLANTNVIDQHVIRQCLQIDAGTSPVHESVANPANFTDLDSHERDYLQRLLQHCGGDKQQAAAIAGISVRSLYRKLSPTP